MVAAQIAAASASLAQESVTTPLVFFRAGFNGNATARKQEEIFEPGATTNLQYESGDISEAVVLGTGARAEYDLSGFPIQAGSLEVRLKPDFPQKDDQAGRTVLSFTGPSEFEMKLVFNPNGRRWMFVLKGHHRWHHELIVWHGMAKEGKWNHFLVTWDKEDGRFTLYHDGKWKDFSPYDRGLGSKIALTIGGEPDLETSIDELVVYSRPFTKAQAEFVSHSFTNQVDRFVAIGARLADDDRISAERKALVAKLDGKVGRLLHHRNMSSRKVSFPEGITGETINPEDIGKVDLGKYAVIYFPEGPKYQVEPEQYQALRDYVENGGGYVGSCQGGFFASKAGLLDYKCYNFWVWGILKVKLRPHIVTDGRSDTITMHFGNGPLMFPGEGCTILGTYASGRPEGVPAAILTGECGKGRVVVFGTHPLGGKVSAVGKKVFFTGRDLETNRMLVNALLYAAGLLDDKGSAPSSERAAE